MSDAKAHRPNGLGSGQRPILHAISSGNSVSSSTPLHHAAVHSLDSVKLLLAAGANAAARDNEGKSVHGEWCYRADQILRAPGAKE